MIKTKLSSMTIFGIIIVVVLYFVMLKMNYQETAVYVSGSVATLEALDGDSNTLHSLTYEVSIINKNKISATLKNLKAELSNSILARVKSGETEIKIDKQLKPGETITIKGKLKIDITGSTDEEIMKQGMIRFVVKSEEYNIFKF